jgi:glycosyltransferase involved in cell wall biosynthesis
MNILLLTFKIDRGHALADALNKIGYTVSVDEIGKKELSIFGNLRRVISSYFKHRGEHDLVITECFDYNGIIALLLSITEDTPYILYVKGFFPEDSLEKTNRLTRYLDKKLSLMVFSRAKAVAYISGHLKNKYEDYFRKEKKDGIMNSFSRVIHHSIDDSYFEPKEHQETRNNVLYVGNLDFRGKAEGLEFLFNLMRGSSEKLGFTLSIAGEGAHLPYLQNLAEKYGLENIQFHGYLGKEELRRRYVNSILFVYPSFQDAFPSVVMEAQAMGLPAVVTDTSGAKEIVVDEVTGYVCRLDNDFLNKINVLLNDDRLREKMSKSAMENILKNFTWEKTAIKFDELISEVKL